MKRTITAVCLLILLHACTESKSEDDVSTALDAGRVFIRASLNGDFEKAGTLLLRDSQNLQLFDQYKIYYKKLPLEKKENYKKASYEINKFEELSDSVTIINYSNSYMNKPMEIKVLRANDQWKVDFKYIYSGNLPIN